MRCAVETFHRRCKQGLVKYTKPCGTRLSTHKWIDEFFEGAIEGGMNVKLRVRKPDDMKAAVAYLESLKDLERPRARG